MLRLMVGMPLFLRTVRRKNLSAASRKEMGLMATYASPGNSESSWYAYEEYILGILGSTALNFSKLVDLYEIEKSSFSPMPMLSMGTKNTVSNFFLASARSLRLLSLFSWPIMHRDMISSDGTLLS